MESGEGSDRQDHAAVQQCLRGPPPICLAT